MRGLVALLLLRKELVDPAPGLDTTNGILGFGLAHRGKRGQDLVGGSRCGPL